MRFSEAKIRTTFAADNYIHAKLFLEANCLKYDDMHQNQFRLGRSGTQVGELTPLPIPYTLNLRLSRAPSVCSLRGFFSGCCTCCVCHTFIYIQALSLFLQKLISFVARQATIITGFVRRRKPGVYQRVALSGNQ